MTQGEKILTICESIMCTDLSVKKRSNDLFFKKCIFYLVYRQFLRFSSYKEIGDHVNRTHSSVINGLNSENEILSDVKYSNLYLRCLNACKNYFERSDFLNDQQDVFHHNSEVYIDFLIAENAVLKKRLEEIKFMCGHEI